MPKSNEVSTAQEYFVPSAIPSLKAYFGRVREGNADVYDTPFAKGESTQHMLREWSQTLKSITRTWPSLWDYEIEQSHKVGPLSVMKPLAQRMEDIEAYYKGILLPGVPIADRALRAAIAEWKQTTPLQPRSQVRTLENMKLSTNSGSPYFTKRRNVKNSIVSSVSEIHNDVVTTRFKAAGGHLADYDSCAVLGWRGQEGGADTDDVKQRVVWMFPAGVNLQELQVYQPLIEAAQQAEIFPAWVSMESVDVHVTRLFDTKSPHDLIVCTDFSKFDQHFNRYLQDAAETILSAIFVESKFMSNWFENVYGIKYMIPLMYDYGVLRTGFHGMGSGSGGTNQDESLAHRALQYDAAQKQNKMLNPNSMCLGDDGILSYPGITVKDVVAAYTSHGLEMNTDKQYASTQDCIFLRRWHHTKYRIDGKCAGVYPTMRALGRMRYLERYMNPKYWDATKVNLRYLSILENVKYHPLREEFVNFCMKRDKYRLGLDIPGFFDNLGQISRKAIDEIPDLIGYVQSMQGGVDGINEWWVVKYLKSLR